MSDSSLRTNFRQDNLEQAKSFLAANLSLSQHSCLGETLDHIDQLQNIPFPKADLECAAAEMHKVDEKFLYVCQKMRQDPEIARAAKDLMDTIDTLEEYEPESGKKLVTTIRDLYHLERKAKQEAGHG